MYLTRHGFEIRFEWGPGGVEHLGTGSDALVIVDVLSFSTCVDVACARGAEIYPYRWRDDSARDFAQRIGGSVAARRGEGEYWFSPGSLLHIPEGTRLVVPSPNGSALSVAASEAGIGAIFAGCLRNASAVAAAAVEVGPRVSVIAAGERYRDGTLSPALEDLLGAGAVVHALPGSKSPEARAAEAAFLALRGDLARLLLHSASGRELVEAGRTQDVLLAAELDASRAAPRLLDGAYRWAPGR